MPLKIVRNNITRMRADAIVNTANPYPIIGSGVDQSIYTAAGAGELLDARRAIGEIPPGQAAITPAFGLKAKYIIHAVTPKWRGGQNLETLLLRSTYEQIMELAVTHNCQSVALPLLATGHNRFPRGLSLRLAREVSEKYLSLLDDFTIYLVVYDRAAFALAAEQYPDIEAYLDKNYFPDEPEIDAIGERSVETICYEHVIASEDELESRECLNIECPSEARESSPRARKKDLGDTSKMLFNYSKVALGSQWPEFIHPHVEESFSERLLRIIDKKGFKDTEVYKKANIDRKLFSKIRKKSYHPGKKTALALLLALQLNVDEATDLLSYAGMAFAPNDFTDMIVKGCLENGIFDVLRVNEILFAYNLETLN